MQIEKEFKSAFEIMSISELEQKAAQYWIEMSSGGCTPNEKDMFIAGFVLGCKTINKQSEFIEKTMKL